jgi:hypothetical protein
MERARGGLGRRGTTTGTRSFRRYRKQRFRRSGRLSEQWGAGEDRVADDLWGEGVGVSSLGKPNQELKRQPSAKNSGWERS